jgi:hypothetical protein
MLSRGFPTQNIAIAIMVETKPEVAKQDEVPNVDAVVKPVKGWKRRHRGKKQAAR